MENYLITKNQLIKLKMPKEELEGLERIFNYTTYSDIEMELANRGIEYDEKLLEECENAILVKFDDDRASELVEFLIYKKKLKI